MLIKDIRLKETNETRTDGRYPLRIGSTVDFYTKPTVGDVMMLAYITDKEGNPKDGVLRTDTIVSIDEQDNVLVVTTERNIYFIER